MIKTIQLLKESFATYKANIKNIFWMTWPIALLTIIGSHYSSTFEGMGKVRPIIFSVLLIGIVVSTISFVFVGLFFKPALNRSLQKNEDNNNFDIKDGFDFAKKNIWNYIVLGFWTIVYSIKVNIKYLLIILGAITLFAISAIFIKSNITFLIISSVVFGLIIIAAIVFAIVKNTTKFILPTNIFFSKDIKPRDAVKESIDLGKNNDKDIWKMILSSVVFMLITILIYFFIGLILGIVYRFVPENISKWIEITVSALIASIVISPISLIIFAKGYNKIAGEVMVMEEVKEEVVTE